MCFVANKKMLKLVQNISTSALSTTSRRNGDSKTTYELVKKVKTNKNNKNIKSIKTNTIYSDC